MGPKTFKPNWFKKMHLTLNPEILTTKFWPLKKSPIVYINLTVKNINTPTIILSEDVSVYSLSLNCKYYVISKIAYSMYPVCEFVSVYANIMVCGGKINDSKQGGTHVQTHCKVRAAAAGDPIHS